MPCGPMLPCWPALVTRQAAAQAVRAEGIYPNGAVTVRPLPAELHGAAATRTVPLRRLEGGQIRQQDLDDHLAKERQKVRGSRC